MKLRIIGKWWLGFLNMVYFKPVYAKILFSDLFRTNNKLQKINPPVTDKLYTCLLPTLNFDWDFLKVNQCRSSFL